MKRTASKVEFIVDGEEDKSTFCITPPRSDFCDEDGYLRREFDKLDVPERERVMRELYGISEDKEEDPQSAKSSLNDLDRELVTLAASGTMKGGFIFARDNHAHYFENEEFRLKFLRAVNFDAKQAAQRIVKHFQVKLQIFGLEKLGREITLDDLDEDDREKLRGVQPVPSKDRAGRAVVFTRLKDWNGKESSNLMRAIWFTMMRLVQEKDVQTRGSVMISYNVGPFSTDCFNRNLVKNAIHMVLKALPVKIVSWHFCFDDIRFRMVWGLFMVFLGKAMRVRARLHEGTNPQCRYGLMTYGIPVDKLPISIDGIEDNSNLEKWLETVQEKEKDEESTSYLV